MDSYSWWELSLHAAHNLKNSAAFVVVTNPESCTTPILPQLELKKRLSLPFPTLPPTFPC